MKKAFRRLFENIDVYITLSLAVIFAVLGFIGTIPVAVLLAGILATLSILAYSMLATRRILGTLSQSLASLYPTASVLLKDRTSFGSFQESLNSVNTIWLYGPSLVVMWATHKDAFRKNVQAGGKIRVLIFNVSSKNLSIQAEQLGVDPDKLAAEIRATRANCKELLKRGLRMGEFEIRETEMMPGYSMVILNPSEHNGEMVIEYLGYHVDVSERPHIELDAARDRRWFTFYLKQYEKLWENATPVLLDDLI